jgi:hypothetical protein
MTLAIWVLALLGGIRRLFVGRFELTSLILVSTPFLIIGLNSYGGEALLRVYLFALPFTVFLAATLVFPTQQDHTSARTAAALGAISLLLMVGFLFTRYGNERADLMTRDEEAAFQYLYANAPAGSVFVEVAANSPARYRDTEKYHFAPDLGDSVLDDINRLTDAMRSSSGARTYLVLTQSQTAYGELFHGKPPGWTERLQAALLATGQYKVIFENQDAIIMVLAGSAS